MTYSAQDYLDEDGYPTEDALDRIEHWYYNDPKGWFKFIESIWHLKSWGWTELKRAELDSVDKIMFHISTAGWSGNEDIIRAMQQNHILWSDTWVESRRGGHYVFEMEEIE
jgi:hypothetical protein